MPAYNTEPYIADAISSILNQTYKNIELLVYDDGSTDTTWEVINSFDDNRLRKFRGEKNQGLLKASNYMYAQCKGDYIANQDSDDWSDLTRIEKQLAIFNKYPEVGVTGTSGYFYRSEDVQFFSNDGPGTFISAKDATKNFPFIPASVMFKKEVLKVVPGMHEYFDKLIAMDLYFYFGILYHFKGYHIPEHLYYARFTINSNTRSYTNIRKFVADDVYYLLRDQKLETGTDWLEQQKFSELKKFEDSLLSNKKFLSEKYRGMAAYYIDVNQFKGAMPFLKKAFLYNPFNVNIYRSLAYIIKKLLHLNK